MDYRERVGCHSSHRVGVVAAKQIEDDMLNKRIAILMGGRSSEHDISLESGAQVVEALKGEPELTSVVIQRDGAWRFADGDVVSAGQAMDRLVNSVDVVVPMLHGQFGEDGTVQALLEVAGLPFVGSDMAASAAAMDKVLAKRVYRDIGLTTPKSYSVLAFEDPDDAVIESIYPCVVKLSKSGSSVGVFFPPTLDEAKSLIRRYAVGGEDVLIEEVVNGKELTCGVLDLNDGPNAFPVTEIRPSADYTFYDLAAKYTAGATLKVTPAEVPDSVALKVQEMAVKAHVALRCRDYSRSDFILRGEVPLMLETNTIPGMTPTSLYPIGAAAIDISFEQLVYELLGRALSRGPRVF